MNDKFKLQKSIKDVISHGGWTLLNIDEKITDPMRDAVLKFSDIIIGAGEEKLGERITSNIETMPALFDALNHSTEIMELQNKFSQLYLSPVMTAPLLWTYPNIRIDVRGRENFNAPGHADDWISFRGKKNIIVWLPIIGMGNIDICPLRSKFEVVAHDYWGLSLKNEKIFDWEQITVGQDEVLVFRNDLIHKSSNVFDANGFRITAQLRYEDLCSFGRSYNRAVTQVITPFIKYEQKKLIELGFYDNR